MVLMTIDFAKNARATAVAHTVHEEELRKLKTQSRGYQLDRYTVLPKTMTHDYESWWRVGGSG